MADKPWVGKVLSKGQIIQELERAGCRELEALGGPLDRALWVAPTGKVFHIAYNECDAEYLEAVVAKVRSWVDEHGKGRS